MAGNEARAHFRTGYSLEDRRGLWEEMCKSPGFLLLAPEEQEGGKVKISGGYPMLRQEGTATSRAAKGAKQGN